MGLVRRTVLFGVGFAGLLAAGRPAVAVEATLVADAHVNSALPAVNSGAISNLNVGGGYTALLQFDLSTLPAGTTAAQVTRATLRLYCNRMDTAGLVSLQAVSGAWGEYSVTYATLPSLGAAAQVVQVGQAGAYVAVDVTALVQGWLTAPATNHGVALTAGTAVVQFDSKENDLTGHAAVLDVALASTGGAGTVGPAGPSGPINPMMRSAGTSSVTPSRATTPRYRWLTPVRRTTGAAALATSTDFLAAAPASRSWCRTSRRPRPAIRSARRRHGHASVRDRFAP